MPSNASVHDNKNSKPHTKTKKCVHHNACRNNFTQTSPHHTFAICEFAKCATPN